MASSVTAEAVSHAFRRAAKRSLEYSHPDHLSIIGIAEQSGLPVAVTMLPEGRPFSELLTEQPAPLGESMKRVSQIAHAVSALHVSELRHGYLIPENLWVREDGRVSLLDSGVHAAAAHAAFSSGFPIAPCPFVPTGDTAYEELNQSADVYALVALLLRLVTGRSLPAEGLLATVEALPAALPASLRTELRDAVTTPRPSTAPGARSLAVHLAFDTAWIHAQERLRREQDVVDGELLHTEAASRGEERDGVKSAVVAQWMKSHPTAGVRGGAASGTVPEGMLSRLTHVGKATVDGVTRLLPRGVGGSRRIGAETTPLIASFAVRLGPYADPKTASSVRARVRRSWPMAAVIADGGGYYVQVTTCSNRRRAEELIDRLREAGDPAEVSRL
jgi:hypothetical protein